jgi:molybdate transport system substrate-binding protein
MTPSALPRALALAMGLALAACSRPPDRLVVAAASDLTQALPELAAAFQAQTGVEVAPSFGASKLLALQILEGAPFDLFLSADTALVDDVVARGRCDAATRATYGRGHLVMWVRDGAAPRDLASLVGADVRHIAIANPETAPYGAAARQALERAGVWERVADRVVNGENVRQALQFVESGNADVALVARALVIGQRGAWTPVPAALHAPLVQSLVVCGARGADGGLGRASARAFAQFVTGPEGQAILARWGLGSERP